MVEIMDLTFVLRSLKGRFHGNQFWGQIGEIGLSDLHSSRWLSETDWNIATPMDASTSATTCGVIPYSPKGVDLGIISSGPQTLVSRNLLSFRPVTS